MLKRLLFATAPLLLVVGCSDTPAEPSGDMATVTSAAVESPYVIDGRAGQFLFTSANLSPTFCSAVYDEPVPVPGVGANTFVSGATTDYKVTENKNMVMVRCGFTDVSGIYESNSEIGPVESCSAMLEDGRYFENGTGRVTAAANNSVGDGEDSQGNDGGNTWIRCTFPTE